MMRSLLLGALCAATLLPLQAAAQTSTSTAKPGVATAATPEARPAPEAPLLSLIHI